MNKLVFYKTIKNTRYLDFKFVFKSRHFFLESQYMHVCVCVCVCVCLCLCVCQKHTLFGLNVCVQEQALFLKSPLYGDAV